MKRGARIPEPPIHLAGPQPVIGPPMALGAPSFSERLMRALELKGLLPNFIRPGFSPVILSADLTQGEYRWLSRERMYFGSMIAAASPGNNQVYELIYGAPSFETSCIVDEIRIYNKEAVSSTWGIYIASAIAGGAANTRISPLDGRSDGPGNGGAIYASLPAFAAATMASLQLVQAIPATAPTWEVPPTSSLVIPGPWVLTLQHVAFILRVHSNAVNVGSSVVFKWRERQIQSSEQS
jgi:hypothetical protein